MTAARKLNETAPVSEDLGGDESEYFRDLIKELAGISMSAAKHELIKSRLRSRLSALGGISYRQYKDYLKGLPKEHAEWQALINLLTTNKTDFFRESQHFSYLVHTFLPQWLAGGEKTLKIWSAASSSGQEAYSLAMVLDQHLPPERDFKILATDIDTDVLATAKNAVYPMANFSEIPPEYQLNSVDRGRRHVKEWFRVKPRIKDKVIFKQHNLMELTFPGEDVFDLIFCRNVLIYFEKQGIQFVAQKLFKSAKPGGQLFIGHSESLQGIETEWRPHESSIYKKEGRVK